MRKQLIFTSLLFCLFIGGLGNIYAQTTQELFEKANQDYNNGLFQQAVESYEKIISSGEHSDILYYNIANSYYQLKRVGPAVYYYEKALWLNPNFNDAKYNLSFAENMKIDAIEPLPQTQLQQLFDSVLNLFSLDTWAILTLLGLWGALLFWGLFRWVAFSSSKRVYFGLSIATLLGTLFCAYFSWQADQRRFDPRYAILWDAKIQVQSEPNLRSEFLFEIHEGTKVQVLDALENWQQIQLANGSIGWVKNAQLMQINPTP